jgi:oligopeptidase A
MTVVGHLESVVTTPELRTAYNAVQAPVAEFYAQLPLDDGLWQALRAYADTDDARALTGARHRFLHKTLDDFRRHGAELPPAGKQRLAEIGVALAQITTQFSEHVLDATNAFELILVDPADLAGLPPSAVDAARASAEARGLPGFRFTLQQPSFLAFITYAERADLREKMYRAANICAAPGPHDNRDLLARILQLRHEQAALLGFTDFPDLVLHNRMARTGDTARRFVTDLRARVEPPSTPRTTACRRFAAPSRARTRRPCSPGTSPSTRRSSARRSTTSTTRLCARTFRPRGCWPACSRSCTGSTA